MSQRALLLVVLCGLAGCVLLVSPDAKCSQDSDCEGSGLTCVAGRCQPAAATSSSSGSSGSASSTSTSGSGSSGTGSTGATSSTNSTGNTGCAAHGGPPTASELPSNLQLSNAALYDLVNSDVLLVGGTESIDHATLPTTFLAGYVPDDGGGAMFAAAGQLGVGREFPVLIPTPGGLFVIGGKLADGGAAPDERLSIAGGNNIQDQPLGQLLNVPRWAAGAVVVQGYAYVLGGASFGSDAGILSSVEAAPLYPDGGLGAFQVQGDLQSRASIKLPRAGFGLVTRTQGGTRQLLVVGGVDNPGFLGLGAGPKTVLGFDVLASHDLSQGRVVGTLANSHVDGAAFLDEPSHTLYVMGGADSIDHVYFVGQGPTRDVEALAELDDGGFGNGVDYTTGLTEAREGFGITSTCRDVYLIGGEVWDGVTAGTHAMSTTVDVLHLP